MELYRHVISVVPIYRGKNLVGVNLSEANLSAADLTGADLTAADLLGANLSGTTLVRVKFCNTTMTDGTVNNSGC